MNWYRVESYLFFFFFFLPAAFLSHQTCLKGQAMYTVHQNNTVKDSLKLNDYRERGTS